MSTLGLLCSGVVARTSAPGDGQHWLYLRLQRRPQPQVSLFLFLLEVLGFEKLFECNAFVPATQAKTLWHPRLA